MNNGKYLKFAEYINTYLYLLKNYKMKSLSKIIYTAICLNYCKNVSCTTRKKNDVIGFYFSELRKMNAFSYEKINDAIEGMYILISNNIVKVSGQDIVLQEQEFCYVKDDELEKQSVRTLIEEIKDLSLESFLSEVYNCV